MKKIILILLSLFLTSPSVRAENTVLTAVESMLPIKVTGNQPAINQLSDDLNEKVNKILDYIKDTCRLSFAGVEEKSSNFINNELLRIAMVLLVSLLTFFWVRHMGQVFRQQRPTLDEKDIIVIELFPWLSFWGICMFMCEMVDLLPVSRHGMITCVTLVSGGLAIRQISSLVYHLNSNILDKKYHESFRRIAPPLVYYGVIALISLGILLTLAILGGFGVVLAARMPLNLHSKTALLFIDLAWYIYMVGVGFFILALQHYHIKRQKKDHQIVSTFNLSLDRLHRLGYVAVVISFLSWMATKMGWMDVVSNRVVQVLAVGLFSIVLLQSTIKIIHYLADTIISWFISEQAKSLLDYGFILKIIGYVIYAFLVATIMASILEIQVYFNKLNAWSEMIFEKGVAIGIIIGIASTLHKIINKITHQMVESQAHLRRSERLSSRLYTLLLLFRNLVPTLLWVPSTILILMIFGLQGQHVLTGFAFLFAALVFVGQSLIQDIIKGFVLILEDIIAIGDHITINEKISGKVERLTFQSISIRDYGGIVHTFPFSKVDQLAHHEWIYSYALVGIEVSYDADINKVIQVMRDTFQVVKSNPKYGHKILKDIEIGGIDHFKEHSIMIKARIKTEPGEDSKIQKNFYKHLLMALQDADISMPIQQKEVHIYTNPDATK